jgi:hypothetical protein
MKRMVLAAALALACAPAAHAADPWILLSFPAASDFTKPIPALIAPLQYPTFAGCAHDQGRVEQTFATSKERAIVWCAQVPGLGQ